MTTLNKVYIYYKCKFPKTDVMSITFTIKKLKLNQYGNIGNIK